MTRWMETCKCGKKTLSTIKVSGQAICYNCLEKDKALAEEKSLVCQYCGKSIWFDEDGYRHDSPGSMPICNHIPEPKEKE